jgi:hypothetical protein
VLTLAIGTRKSLDRIENLAFRNRDWKQGEQHQFVLEGMQAMRKQLSALLAAYVIGYTGLAAWGDPGKHMKLESMLGKYYGVIQVVKNGAPEHPYQTEIVSVNKENRTVSLSAYCSDCDNKVLNRTNCPITEIGMQIKFVCQGPTSDEEYIFNGNRLQATGFGHKYPYAINVTKAQ